MSAEPLPEDLFELRCPALADDIARLRHGFVGFARAVGLPRTLIDDVSIAISEAATNAVLHAYEGAAAPGDVVLTADVSDPALVRVVIADDGAGMRPRPDTTGLGLGLPLLAELADHLAIAPGAGGRGPRVSMEFAVV
jgi:serine/threonine-protein kinase RsbW/stage II sporulation protein AB (anti-sigma F factor)